MFSSLCAGHLVFLISYTLGIYLVFFFITLLTHSFKTEYGLWNLRGLDPDTAESYYKCPPVSKYEVSRHQGLIVFGTIDWVQTTLTNNVDKVDTK